MQIVSASIKSEQGERSLRVLFELEDGSQRWHTVPEGTDRFDPAKDLAVKHLQAETEDEANDLAQELFTLLDTKTRIRQVLETDTSGVFSLNGSQVYYDGSALNEHLSMHIVRMFNSNNVPRDVAGFKAFARFVENLQQNVSPFVREQLFSWMAVTHATQNGFTITSDGCFVAYKGCNLHDDGIHYSGFTGDASVLANGVITDYESTHIPNVPGTVVLMPRASVTANPAVGCSKGLHVATMEFAKGYASRGAVFSVKVNPRDVVSVPTECNAQKIRVARYEILEEVEKVYNDSYLSDFDEPEYDDDWDADDIEDDDCESDSPLTDAQRGEIFAGLEKIGIRRHERDRSLRWISNVVGREVYSRNELTFDEADEVLGAIESELSRRDESGSSNMSQFRPYWN